MPNFYMGWYKLNPDGHVTKCGLDEATHQHIALTAVKDVQGKVLAEVSTVFLGLDHRFGLPEEDRPIVFETMVFVSKSVSGGPEDNMMERYCTLYESCEGHKKMVSLVKQLLIAAGYEVQVLE